MEVVPPQVRRWWSDGLLWLNGSPWILKYIVMNVFTMGVPTSACRTGGTEDCDIHMHIEGKREDLLIAQSPRDLQLGGLVPRSPETCNWAVWSGTVGRQRPQ